ncbi:MAG: hypothetical protein WKF30_06495 [Pyrinomonadaceae bacterium]
MQNMQQSKEWMTTSKATAFLGISTKTMARLIREGIISTYSHPLDRRIKLVRIADVDLLKKTADQLAA